MPFLQHLEELRRTLIAILVAVAVGTLLTWVFSADVLDWLIGRTSGTAIFLKPQGAFLARLKVAFVLGLLLVLPYVFYRLWSFIGPGLLSRERRIVMPSVLASVALFYLGITFSYFVLTPVMITVLMGFGTSILTAQMEINFLLDLVFMTGIACGLTFQLPLLAAFLTSVGVIRPVFLRAYWRHAIVLVFIAAALLTPADPLSQIILAVPLTLLYAVSYFVSTAVYRGKVRRRAEEEEATPEPGQPPEPDPDEDR
jgi:sec-independent protein translocase protein TatC